MHSIGAETWHFLFFSQAPKGNHEKLSFDSGSYLKFQTETSTYLINDDPLNVKYFK